jgi:hypothetical protein
VSFIVTLPGQPDHFGFIHQEVAISAFGVVQVHFGSSYATGGQTNFVILTANEPFIVLIAVELTISKVLVLLPAFPDFF